MYKLTLETVIHGSTFVDEYVKYSCRHTYHKWSIDGRGPTRSRRIKKGSFHYERFRDLVSKKISS